MILNASRMFYSVKLCYFVLGNDALLITAPEKPWVPHLHHSTGLAPLASRFPLRTGTRLPAAHILLNNFHLKIYWRVTS
jgi:hypothetical protein